MHTPIVATAPREKTMKRILLVAVLLSIVLAAAVLWSKRADLLPVRRLAEAVRQELDIMAAVQPDSQFRIFRRRPKDRSWDEGSPFDRTTAMRSLDALATAKFWDGKKHAAAYSPWDVQSPALTIELAWCKDMQNKSQRDAQSVALCYGNWLFWYGDGLYQVSEQSHNVLNKIFPENQ